MSAIHTATVGDVSTLHSIPCRISAENETGTTIANVKVYFDSNTSVFSDGTSLTSSLRGRPLLGAKLQLPDSYKGVVMRAKGVLSADKIITSELSSLYYWNLDATPTKDDKYPRAIQWIKLANAMHQLVPPPCD